MAEVLKRWNGIEWIPVTSINRMVVHGRFTPIITNDDLVSITIDFIESVPDPPDLTILKNEVLWLTSKTENSDGTFANYDAVITGWERVDSHTLKFTLEDYRDIVEPLKVIHTGYPRSSFDVVPQFKESYNPDGLPRRIRASDIIISMPYGFMESASIVETPIANIAGKENANVSEVINLTYNSYEQGSIVDIVAQVELEEV